MKATLKDAVGFHPVTIELTFDTRDELRNFYALVMSADDDLAAVVRASHGEPASDITPGDISRVTNPLMCVVVDAGYDLKKLGLRK